MKRHNHFLRALILHTSIAAVACAGGANAREQAPRVPPPQKSTPTVVLAPPEVAPPTPVWAPPASIEPQSSSEVNDHASYSGNQSAFRVGDPITVHARKSSWSRSHAVPNSEASDTDLIAAIPSEVIAVNPDGRLQIRGLLTASVNSQEQIYRVTGYVRPEDIDISGIVDSRRVTTASLEIVGDSAADSSERKRRIENMFKLLGFRRAQ
ncbi:MULTISPECIES: flagellar basal body L-ring protein FlgH [Lysobacter]|uniref:flagellar basal body L-ring protein FlgH n=1 Tax=Lysobacter TaxID=68 RepID=UPI002286BEFD|nr:MULTISPECIES: flagellar basal body L-ring protein FlgH [Lysobacter]